MKLQHLADRPAPGRPGREEGLRGPGGATAGRRPSAGHRLRQALAATLVLAALGSGAPAQAKETLTAVAVDSAFHAGTVAQQGFTVADAQALKGLRRVAVPVFAVEFIVADQVSASVSSFGAAGRATSSLYIRLQGVGEADFQAITTGLYQQFLADLRAGGLEVVDPAQVVAAPTYARLVATGSPAPIRSDASLVMAPPGLGVYGFARMANGSSAQRKSLLGSLSDMGAGFAAVGAIGDTVQLGTELNASLIEVRLRVNFAQLADENRGFLGRMASSATASAKVFPSIDNLMIGVQTGPQRSTLTSRHSFTVSSDAFAEVREKPTTGSDVAGAVALGLLKAAIGSKDSHSTRELEVLAQPDTYRKQLGQGLAAVSATVAARLLADR